MSHSRHLGTCSQVDAGVQAVPGEPHRQPAQVVCAAQREPARRHGGAWVSYMLLIGIGRYWVVLVAK